MKSILLLAHGGPNDISEVLAVLQSIRGNKPVSKELLDETTRRYKLIGGKSPLLDISISLAKQVQAKTGIATYIAMLHSNPKVDEVLQQMSDDGVTSCTAIVMASFDNSITTKGYYNRVANARFPVRFVSSLYRSSLWLDAVAESCKKGRIIFTAHALPASILKTPDPYVDQFETAAKEVAKKLGIEDDQWKMAYQSAPPSPIEWLGPSLEEVLREMTPIIICPIGFVSAHVEVLYDIDIEAQEIASNLGIQLARTPMLDDSPTMVDILADLAVPNYIRTGVDRGGRQVDRQDVMNSRI